MSTSLEQAVAKLAQTFATEVLRAIRDASLADVAELSAARGARGARVVKGKKGRTPRLGWPKCPTCGKNAHPRGKGYCWEHSEASKVRGAKGGGKPAAKKAGKRPAKKAA